MRNEQAAVTRGEKGRSQIKKELRERDKDENWKGDALKEADEKEKRARRPQASEDEKTTGLAVPQDGEE
ncbi:hypothetical protein [Mesorhizobium sp. WSM2239]|jgi:hypothetical protein|uniref:Uncharacterized protein n=2 Tax=unclassified Mesorhizobium TaxID=325217 RepID=A0AAU8DCZ1_9HYPH